MNIPDMTNNKAQVVEDAIQNAIRIGCHQANMGNLRFCPEKDAAILNELVAKGYRIRISHFQRMRSSGAHLIIEWG